MYDTYVFKLSDSPKAMPSTTGAGKREGMTFLDEGFGDKNIYSTPRDLLKWDQAMYNNQLFSAKTLEEAFTPYSNEKSGDQKLWFRMADEYLSQWEKKLFFMAGGGMGIIQCS